MPFAATACLLAILWFAGDVRGVAAQVANIEPIHFGLAVGTMLLVMVIATVRYYRILRLARDGAHISFATLLKLNFVTLFAAYFLPMSIMADAGRAAASRVLFGLGTAQAVEAILADRGLAVIGLAATGLLFLPLQFYYGWATGIILMQAALFVSIFVIVAFGSLARHVLPNSLEIICRAIERFLRHTGTLENLVWQLAMAIGSSILFATILVILAEGLSLDLPFPIALTTASGIYLAQLVPFLYAGFGSREAAVVALLVPTGVMSASDAVTLAICVGICNLVASAPGALFAADVVGSMRTGRLTRSDRRDSRE